MKIKAPFLIKHNWNGHRHLYILRAVGFHRYSINGPLYYGYGLVAFLRVVTPWRTK